MENVHGINQLQPSDYEFLGELVWPEYDEESGSTFPVGDDTLLAQLNGSVYGDKNADRCAHCGSRLIYSVAFEHKTTGQVIAVGYDCSRERFGLSNEAYRTRLERSKELRRSKERSAAFNAFRAEYPEAAEYLSLAAPSVPFFADMLHAIVRFGSLTERQLEAVERSRVAFSEWNADTSTEDVREYLDSVPEPTKGESLSFVQRIKRQASCKPLTDGQIEAIRRLAEKGAVEAPAISEGRQTIEGTIVSVKEYDNDFGTALKMIVESNDGNRFYSTVPAALTECKLLPDGTISGRVLEAAKIRFTATVSVNGDPNFGRCSRPSKASFID